MNRVYSVSQLNSYIHRIFESDYALRKIYIQGELSNCKYHSSGHIYFTLKDERSSVRCVMFLRDRARGLNFKMENGQLLIVGGQISVYERDGTYQLYAREITLAGAGLLYQKYEQLKQELYEAGYFDFERKKALPPYPKKIGIVTAVTGAAIQDIRSIANRRNPYIQLYLYPAKVQGLGAAQSIAEGIRFFDHFGVDIIIIGRGGGSMEDLWAFNERVVADAIYQAETPIISGTGHEVDTTIADYCADERAPTPSAACEIAIPDVFALLQQLDSYQDRLEGGMERKLDGLRQQLSLYRRLLDAKHPGSRLAQQKMSLANYEDRLHRLMRQKLVFLQHRLDSYGDKLTALSPSNRLGGGYVYAHKADDSPISSAAQLEIDETFSLIFRDGQAQVKLVDLRIDEAGRD